MNSDKAKIEGITLAFDDGGDAFDGWLQGELLRISEQAKKTDSGDFDFRLDLPKKISEKKPSPQKKVQQPSPQSRERSVSFGDVLKQSPKDVEDSPAFAHPFQEELEEIEIREEWMRKKEKERQERLERRRSQRMSQRFDKKTQDVLQQHLV